MGRWGYLLASCRRRTVLDVSEPDYSSMKIGELNRRAQRGEQGAQQALSSFGADLAGMAAPLADTLARITSPLAEMERENEERMRTLSAHMDEVNKLKAQEKRDAVDREQAMLRELGLMRKAAMRADEREAAAVERAEQAEAREIAAEARAEGRERFMVRVTVISAAFGAVGAGAAIVTLVAQ